MEQKEDDLRANLVGGLGCVGGGFVLAHLLASPVDGLVGFTYLLTGKIKELTPDRALHPASPGAPAKPEGFRGVDNVSRSVRVF